VFLISLVAIGFLVKQSGLATGFDEAWIDANVRDQGLVGHLVFIAGGTMLTAVGFPRQLFSFMAGYAFGLAEGSLLAVMTTLLGCMSTFTYARLLGQSAVLARVPRRIRKIDAFLSRAPFAMALVIRLMPVGSNFLTSLAAGVSSISAWRFFAGSGLGFIPQTVIFALVGSGASVASEVQVAISLVLFAVSAAVGVTLFRRYGRDVVVTEDEPAASSDRPA
jgi:uncharacterized membrane protein YdjX (TVP38/TMEM64 family)